MYLSSGRGRKSGGACATGATSSLAPLYMFIMFYKTKTSPIKLSPTILFWKLFEHWRIFYHFKRSGI